MKKVAIIPLRAGSKGIPLKNRKKILGRPLFSWSLSEAINSQLDEVYIYTDDKVIISYVEKEYAWTDKVKVLERGAASATDTASTEDAMLEFAEHIDYDFDMLVLLQATSPLLTAQDIDATIAEVEQGKDSALTVVHTKRFIWSKEGKSLNYDYMARPRRQDFDEGLMMENGAVYATTKAQFVSSKNRLGGDIGVVEMPEDTLYEIDELSDWYVVEKLLSNRLFKQKGRYSDIKLLVLDVDGVFTDAKVTNNAQGEFSKTFSMRDGMGLEILRENGVEVMVMTAEISDVVKTRMEKLQIADVYLGVKDKYSRLTQVLKEKNITRDQVAYMGDDVNDLANISSVALGACPGDAVMDIKQSADLTLSTHGGQGAIRELVDFIMKMNKRN